MFKERNITKIIKELALKMEIEVCFLSNDWIIKFNKNEKTSYVFGYDWEINSATTHILTKDKSACYEILTSFNIPAIEHKLFLNSEIKNHISDDGVWNEIIAYARKNDYNVVCKSNTGSGGNEVFKVKNQKELEYFLGLLFVKNKTVCLSPFYDIENEYRVILLDQEPLLIYSKQKPHVIGDNQHNVLELILKNQLGTNISDFNLTSSELLYIPNSDEKFELSWKHNLAKGAKHKIVEDLELKNTLCNLAIKTAKALNLRLGAIDIIEYQKDICNKDFLIMEVNSGIMLENFSKQGSLEYEIAKNIYRKVLNKIFA